MVGRLPSFWEGLFAGAMLVSGRVSYFLYLLILSSESSFHSNFWGEVMLPMGCAVSCAGILNKWSHTSLDCWTLVDFDGDGDLDIVRTAPDWGQGLDLLVDLNGSAIFSMAASKPRKVEYFEQATWQHTILWKSVGYRVFTEPKNRTIYAA